MARTRRRPLPAHAVTPERAVVFGIVLGAVSVALMAWTVNLVAAFLTLLAIGFYVVVYTIMLKRSTPQNIVIGGAAGALPPVIGWAAVTGDVALPALLLFLIVFYWTPPHFWALALRIRGDYAAAGVPMLPVVRGIAETSRQIGLYTVLLVASALVFGVVARMGALYLVAAVALGACSCGAPGCCGARGPRRRPRPPRRSACTATRSLPDGAVRRGRARQPARRRSHLSDGGGEAMGAPRPAMGRPGIVRAVVAIFLAVAALLVPGPAASPVAAACASVQAMADAMLSGNATVFVGTVVNLDNEDRWATVLVDERWHNADGIPDTVFVHGSPEAGVTSSEQRVYAPGRYVFAVTNAGPNYEDSTCTATTAWSDDLARYRPGDVAVAPGTASGSPLDFLSRGAWASPPSSPWPSSSPSSPTS